MLKAVSGSAVELGARTGLNFRYYTRSVVQVLAVEPEPFLRGSHTLWNNPLITTRRRV
jgi:hypothetical protein